MKRLTLAVLLLPSIAFAQTPPAPPTQAPANAPTAAPGPPPLTPSEQALLYLKQAADTREANATIDAFAAKTELIALKMHPSQALIDKFSNDIDALTKKLAFTEGLLAVANTDKDKARAAMAECPKLPSTATAAEPASPESPAK